MGLLFSPILSWTAAKIKLASQAQKALNSIINYQRKYGYLLHTDTFKFLMLQLNLFFAMDPRFGGQNIVMLLDQFMQDSAESF